jgi:hypothetical protein
VTAGRRFCGLQTALLPFANDCFKSAVVSSSQMQGYARRLIAAPVGSEIAVDQTMATRGSAS